MNASDLSYLDTIAVSVFYQITLYLAIRLAHHSFTLGELGFVVFGACILFHEAFNLTIARVSNSTSDVPLRILSTQ